jgi:hypothetical protein
MKRRALSPLVWLIVGLLALCSLGQVLQPWDWRPEHQSEALTQRVFAYRQWQSTGIKLEAGDRFTLRARGEWMYSPIVGLNGPTGGRPAVASYPMPQVLGGTLIGRLGETGTAFYVGAGVTNYVERPGFLFLRINDDLLGDNEGDLTVEIAITRGTATPRP